MSQYEIEIKSLLGDKNNVEILKQKMCELDPNCSMSSCNTQLNHYFEGGDIKELQKAVDDYLTSDVKDSLSSIVSKGKDFSIRTRQKDDLVYLVVKASVDEGSSANTISRLEFEELIDLTLAELDEILQKAGFEYQAKWSREREEYNYKGLNVCIDKNAGYGYLAEFEKVLDNEDEVTITREKIDEIMSELGISELPQDRLERMFSHYNKNWRDYYGTDNTFLVE